MIRELHSQNQTVHWSMQLPGKVFQAQCTFETILDCYQYDQGLYVHLCSISHLENLPAM